MIFSNSSSGRASLQGLCPEKTDVWGLHAYPPSKWQNEGSTQAKNEHGTTTDFLGCCFLFHPQRFLKVVCIERETSNITGLFLKATGP